MHVNVTDDPEEIRAIKARYFEAGGEFHLVPVLEFPEEGVDESRWEDIIINILSSGDRVIICSMEFAEQFERLKELADAGEREWKKRMDAAGEHLSEAVRKSGVTVNELTESFTCVGESLRYLRLRDPGVH